MSVNEDGMQPGSDSFWEVGKYMRTVKRCDNGHQLCSQLRKLIEERSEIERRYAGMLQEWSRKWGSFLDKDIEYGTTEAAWRGTLTEAEEVANLHTGMAEHLMSDVYTNIKSWQKENYHKSMMHFKETKEFEESFRKAQKPWAKRLTKAMAAKKDYHTACRAEKSMTNQENNAKGDNSLSSDQLKKLQDKLRKCQQEVESTKEKYTASISDISSYNAKYIEDMTEVFNKCQEFDQKRIEFLKKTFFQIHRCLDLSVDPKFSQIYTSLHSTINNVDYNKDLKWWSANNGVDMTMNWPSFEEYSPELVAITKRGKSNLTVSDGGVVITGIKHSRDDSFGSSTTDPSVGQNRQTQPYSMQSSTTSTGAASGSRIDRYDESLNPFDDVEDKDDDDISDKNENGKENAGQDVPKPDGQEHPVVLPRTEEKSTKSHSPANRSHSPANRSHSPANNGENPFGEPGDDDDDDAAEEPSSQGWSVRALYDYTRAEEDELEFKAGDVFIQIATEDEMGWCRGKKDGKIGFYPKNYVERI